MTTSLVDVKKNLEEAIKEGLVITGATVGQNSFTSKGSLGCIRHHQTQQGCNNWSIVQRLCCLLELDMICFVQTLTSNKWREFFMVYQSHKKSILSLYFSIVKISPLLVLR